MLKAHLDGFFIASVLGVISPKTNKIKVTKTVIIPSMAAILVNPIERNRSIKKAVAKVVAAMLARLLPIRIAVNSFLGCWSKNSIWCACFFCASIIERSLILLIAVKAVSAAEKKADKKIKSTNIMVLTKSISINIVEPSNF